MNTRGLLNYIENVRYGRNITQEEFLDGIVSRRQYQRYRNGESYVPLDVVEQLASRLGISSRKLMLEFEKEEYIQSEQIKTYYNLVIARVLDEAMRLEVEIEKYNIIDEERELDFRSASTLRKYYQGIISKEELLRGQATLVGYPAILKSEIITDGEAQILGIIQEFSVEDREPIIQKLEKMIESESSQITGGNILSRLQTMFYIAKHYGRVNELKKVRKYCTMGINICKLNKSYYLLAHFTYYLALANYRLDDNEDVITPLKKSALALLLDDDGNKLDRFVNYFSKDLEVDFNDLIEEMKID